MSSGCNPSCTSISFTELAPSITLTRSAWVPSSTSLKMPTRLLAWPYAGRGYFKLKRQIPQLLETAGLGDTLLETG